jgi:hypothetical protein
MDQERDAREQGALQAAYRDHLREMTTARQAAEQAHKGRDRDPAARREAAAVFRRELASIAEAHQAWLRAHGLTDPR